MSDLKEIHSELMAAIADIDIKLDSLGDAKSAGKRKLVSDRVDSTETVWSPVADRLIEQITAMDPDQIVGVFNGIVRKLNGTFAEQVSSYVETLVESQPASEPLITQDEAKELSSVRSTLYAKAKSVVDLASQFGDETLEMPKKRTGARGKRGPRAISFFTWEINGESVAEELDNLPAIAKKYGFEKGAELTKAMREAGLDLRNPGERLEFTLPNGDVLVGINTAAETDEEDEGDEDE
jgi:hypothetical protein